MRDVIPSLGELLATIAEQQLGLCEEPRGSNQGRKIQKFFDADNYDPIQGPGDHGYPWCASFVCWVVQEAMRREPDLFRGIAKPVTPAAFGLEAWGRNFPGLVRVFTVKDLRPVDLWPRRGDIVIYNFSHCGVVTAAGVPDRHFAAVEGNTDSKGSREGWEVARKARTFNLVRSWVRIVGDKA